MRLEGKIAAVTGGGSGMGKAISQAYAREGARVVVTDLNLEAARGVAEQITTGGGEAIPVQTDVRDQAQAQAMIDAAVATYGGLDVLVNNAGVGKIVPFLETTNEDWDFMFDVNCKGLLWCSQAAARQMIEQGRGGKIVNLASQAGRRGESLVLAYCASKACVISMNQSMALALAEHKINVNAIAPGIAAALVATVAGLGVAIPALFGYNYLISRIKDLTNDMQVFIDEFVTKMAEFYSADRIEQRIAAE